MRSMVPGRRTLLVAAAILCAVTSQARETGEPAEARDEIAARVEWFRQFHVGGPGPIPFRARSRALDQVQAALRSGALKPAPRSIAGDTWQPIGPTSMVWGALTFSGRVSAIAAHPTDPNTVYAGTANGGVWKTTDGGSSWTPLTDSQKSLAIGSITIDPSNPNRIYAGTGEAADGCGGYFGSGILRSDDAGATWSLLGEADFGGTSVAKIVVHPTAPNTLWAVNAQGAAGFVCTADPGTDTYGVRKSTDGGTTWTLVLGTAQTGVTSYAYDLVLDPTNPNVLYAAVGGSGVWKTTNGGTSWSKLSGGLPVSSLGRVDLAMSPANSQTLYAVFERATAHTQLGTWKTTNGGSSWTALPPVPVGDVCMTTPLKDICTYASAPNYGFCDYALYVEVAPSGTVYLGGVGLWRSTDGGASWLNACSAESHVDQHAAAFSPGGRVWTGSDGGVFRSDDGGVTWQNRNTGLMTAQFYPGASLHPVRAGAALGGTQDNGTQRYSGVPGWTLAYTGDGAYTAYDSSDPDHVWYVSTEYLQIFKTVDDGANVAPATNGLTDAGSLVAATFIAPFAICPSNPQQLIAGSDNVWRTTNGAQLWQSNSPDPLAGTLQTIQSLAYSPSDTACNTYFAGMTYGRLYRTTAGGGQTGWTNVTGALPVVGVSDIAIDPVDGNTAYVALTGFGTPHVYKSTNALAGAPVWTAISAGLPDIPVNAIVLDPDDRNVLTIGTDAGIFRSVDAGTTWSPFANGLPNAPVYDLVANGSTGSLVAFTYGRGAYRLAVSCSSDTTPCGPVGDTLAVDRGPSGAALSWGRVSCPDLAGYRVYGATSYDMPFPDGWTVLGDPVSESFTDPFGSPWVAYRVVSSDTCGNRSGY